MSSARWMWFVRDRRLCVNICTTPNENNFEKEKKYGKKVPMHTHTHTQNNGRSRRVSGIEREENGTNQNSTKHNSLLFVVIAE